ncbi:hypothetical protein SSX86_018275 [Deinandra increscens subsp. villosa]|uniref:F-box domain-containing protein n=1 Tax=Deinandra increscens subsp. villosa TaxID=3103831 RepID=A0AAP0GW64_9ASTR
MADPTLLLFPEDVIYKILSRLPIKSLARFRCVCKLWLKYIDSLYLRTIHVKEEPTPIMFQRFPSNVPHKMRISFLRGVKMDPVLDLCYKTNSYYYNIQFIGSCNGLILLRFKQENPYDARTYRFVVIDPLTKGRHCLPPVSVKIRSDSDGPCRAAGIGFEDSTNTFKTVFSFLRKRKMVCTLVHSSGMRSWRKIAQNPAYPIIGGGVFSDGRLHWLTCDSGDEYVYFRKIVWFDVKTEEFGLPMDPPEGWHPKGPHNGFVIHLVDLNGEVGYAYIGPISIKLWILKHEEWVLHCSFDLGRILPEYSVYDVQVWGCWNKDGDILLTCDGREGLFVYTLKSGDLQQVELCDPEDGFPYIVMYQSSFLSVNTSAYYYSS